MKQAYEDITKSAPAIVTADAWLAPYDDALRWRRRRYYEVLDDLERAHGSLAGFANAHLFFGVHAAPEGFYYREWAPAAQALFLVGDFNHWNRGAHPLRPLGDGVWEIFLPRSDYQASFTHGSRIKVHVVTDHGGQDRLPLYARCVVQELPSRDFMAQVWLPETPYAWKAREFRFDPRKPALIYEAHVGMAQEYEGVGSYREFADQILPRIAAGGYTAIQLMGIMEHPYYGSFGYHVTNFYAASSRFGTPEDLKYLIDRAHELGLGVFLDVVHSHAAKNRNEGLNEFDGTVWQFFHAGGRGDHPLWDSKLFDYGRRGVLHFLLSNLKFWLEEYRFDGFRFDGVTSMMYLHHGVGTGFGHGDGYFLHGIDTDGITYLQLANTLVHQVQPHSVTIAEDVSGMPGIAAPIEAGGMGFDYRLAMGLPDYWFQLVKTRRDEDWSMQEIMHSLLFRRHSERHVAYVESHDQSLVGDKTMSFTLMDKAMYWHMGVGDKNYVVARGMALHKMIRLLTLVIGGDAYLNFMGNEFGHPEWVDFPREGNGWSYKHARRQWSLATDPRQKYRFLLAFDRAMLQLVKDSQVLEDGWIEQLMADDEKKVLAFARGGLVFAFNFHPHESHPELLLPVKKAGTYSVAFDSDAASYGGHGRIDASVKIGTEERQDALAGDEPALRCYLPARTVVVYRPVH